MRTRVLAIATIVVLLAGTGLASTFTDASETGIGARPLAMGRAYHTIADDACAIFTNPAGLGRVKNISAVTMYSNMLNEIPYSMAAVAYKTNFGTIGLGYAGLSAGDIQESYLDGGGVPQITGNTASYNNSTLILSYANKAKNVPIVNGIKVLADSGSYFGTNIKYTTYGFSGAPSFEGKGASGFDMDLGLIIMKDNREAGSLTLKNIIPGNNIKNDELPMSLTGGVLLNVLPDNLSLALEAELKDGLAFRCGTEWRPVPMVALRAGIDENKYGVNYSAGLGMKVKGFSFDYAYHTYAELAECSTHFFSISYTGDEREQPAKAVLIPSPEATMIISSPATKEVSAKKPVKKKQISKKPVKKKQIAKKPMKKKQAAKKNKVSRKKKR